MGKRRSDYRRISGSSAGWIKGAAVLGAAAVVSKLLGTLQKIPLQNVAGDGVYGIYTVVYPFYVLILFLTTAGFPVAVSAFVSQEMASGDRMGAARVLKVSVVLLSISGTAGFVLLFFGADSIAAWIGNRETAPSIRSVSFALLFVPIMSALRGYFQGGQNMMPTAVSQVVEQFVRVGTMVAVLILMSVHPTEDRYVAAGATFGAVTGALAGMVVMLMYWRKHTRHNRISQGTIESVFAASHRKPESYPSLARRLLRYALPICLGAVVVPTMNIVDSFTLPRLLHEPGMTEEAVMALIGVYSRGQPLVVMASMLVSSMAVALVPAIAEAKAGNHKQMIRNRTEFSIRATWMIGAAASIGLAITALPVNRMLYTDDQGTAAIAIIAFTAAFSMLNIVSASALQGSGLAAAPAVNMLIAAVCKTGLNVWLTPLWGINGAAIAAVIAFAVAAALNLIVLVNKTGISLPFSMYLVKPCYALAVMALVVWGWTTVLGKILDGIGLPVRGASTIMALTGIMLGVVIYAACMLRLKVFSEEELRILPGMEKKLLPIMRKLYLIQ